MQLLSLHDLLIEHIRDLYHAELQYKELLPELVANATDDELRQQLTTIIEQVDTNIGCLQHACQILEVEPTGGVCEAMRGLVREARETLSRTGDPYVIDAALIANAQRIAHYQIAGYGTVRQFARVERADRVADILQDLAARAGVIDHLLTKVANGGWFTRGVNQHAERAAARLVS